MNQELNARAEALHKDLIVVDTHVDASLRLVDMDHDLTTADVPGWVDLPRMVEGNLSCTFWASWISAPYFRLGKGYDRLMELMDVTEKFASDNAGRAGMARTSADIRRLAAEGRHAIVHCIEGGQAIGDRLDLLDELAERGVSYITLTHYSSTDWSDSDTDHAIHGGLSDVGREAIRRMNKVGIAPDLSHVSDEAFWQAIELSTTPVIVSHSSARALTPHARNHTDEMIAELGRRKGVIGLCPWPEFISRDYMDEFMRRALELDPSLAERETGYCGAEPFIERTFGDANAQYNILLDLGLPFPSLELFVDHIDHAVKLAGIDHVAIGSDNSAIQFELVGLEDATKLPNLTKALLQRGYSEQDVRKIMGENVLALMDRVAEAKG